MTSLAPASRSCASAAAMASSLMSRTTGIIPSCAAFVSWPSPIPEAPPVTCAPPARGIAESAALWPRRPKGEGTHDREAALELGERDGVRVALRRVHRVPGQRRYALVSRVPRGTGNAGDAGRSRGTHITSAFATSDISGRGCSAKGLQKNLYNTDTEPSSAI